MNRDYEPLLVPNSPTNSQSGFSDKDLEYHYAPRMTSPSSRRRKAELAAFVTSTILNALLAFGWLSYYHSTLRDPIWGVREPVYSPAQGVIKYETRVFNKMGVKTVYHGPPNNDTDDAWNALYPIGMLRITEDEANLLPNRTEALFGDESHYLISLDVFHQLHCLNNVRKALWPERYGPVPAPAPLPGSTEPFDHIDHCINVIRESLMCSGDISPNVWQWDERIQLNWPHFDGVHTCRNWEAITEWAADHKLLHPFRREDRPPTAPPLL